MHRRALPVRSLVACLALLSIVSSSRDALAQPPAMTADEVADLLEGSGLSVPHFRTTIVREVYTSRPAADDRPWNEVPVMTTTTSTYTISNGLLHATIEETDTRSGTHRSEESWDGSERWWKGVDPGDRSNHLNISYAFALHGDMGMNEALRFTGIESRFPVRNRLGALIRTSEVLDQSIENDILTHRYIAGQSAHGCSVYTIRARLKPTFELLQFEMIIADAPDPAEADDHILMKARLDFIEWDTIDGVRLPTLMHRDAFGPTDRDRREETMTQSRVVYRRTSFEQLDEAPDPESMSLPVSYGDRVHDAGRDPQSFDDDLHFTIGSAKFQYGRLRFDIDDPILSRPGDDFISLAKRARVAIGRGAPMVGAIRLFMGQGTGGPSDAVRAELRAHDAAQPTVDPRHTDPGDLAAVESALRDWHIERVRLIGKLWEAEADAPELPRLLLDRWKYADLVPGIDLASELDRFAAAFPNETDALLIGRYWHCVHDLTRPDANLFDRRAAIERLQASGVNEALPARAMLLAWLVSSDPGAADEFQRLLVNAYPNAFDARMVHSRLRSTDAIGEIANFEFVDLRTGKKRSIREFRGSVVAINFWATWCGPCIQSMPHYKEHFQTLKEKYGDRFEMIGVSLDADPQVALEFAEREALPWHISGEPNKGWDNTIARLYGVSGIPRTIIIGSDGRVRNTDARALNFLDSDVQNVFFIEERELKEAAKESGD